MSSAAETLPLDYWKHDPLLPFAYEGKAHGIGYRCVPGRYAKGKMSIFLEYPAPKEAGESTFKGAAGRLLDALNAKWNGRSGYVISPRRAKLWRKLFDAGWDAEMDWRNAGIYASKEPPKLEAPDGRKLTLREAELELFPKAKA